MLSILSVSFSVFQCLIEPNLSPQDVHPTERAARSLQELSCRHPPHAPAHPGQRTHCNVEGSGG